MRLRDLQKQHREWSAHNFGHIPKDPKHPILGMTEELGELCHAHLKMEQGIRGTKAEHMEKIKDAAADLVVFLCDYCNHMGIDLEGMITQTWEEVRQRDWIKFPKNGRTE